MYSAALNDSDPGQEKIALALLDAGSPDLKRRMNAQARGVGFLSLSPAIYERLIKPAVMLTNAFLKASNHPSTWSAPRKNRRNASFLSLNFSSTRERIPTSRTWMA